MDTAEPHEPQAPMKPTESGQNSGDLARERLEHAREVVRVEARAIARLEDGLGPAFLDAVQQVLDCQGQVIVTGMGKAGLVGAKLSATLASTGTPSISLHPSEAMHGDLGRIRPQDLVLVLSNSGETAELLLLLPHIKSIGATILLLTGSPGSTLALKADAVLDCGSPDEACPLGLAPTASTTAMMALGDALAMVVLSARGFQREDFARFHPAGSLGRKLMQVKDLMRTGDELPLVPADCSLIQIMREMTRTRAGAALLVHADGKLAGIFTDGDLRRLVESDDAQRDRDVLSVAARDPKTIRADALVAEAEHLLREHRIDQIPVVDAAHKPVGLLDVQDLLPSRI
ncbi:MAG: arabinose-5-phosphate isomerase [Planctomycetota bacterium]|jgi:arabinose-5-phosphate isomerase